MKTFIKYTLTALLAGIGAVACTQAIDTPELGGRESVLPQEGGMAGQKITITATVEEDAADTKTMLGPGSADGLFNWTPGDEINLIFGSGQGARFYTPQSFTEPAPRASFEGLLPAAIGIEDGQEDDLKFWGIFPYNRDNSVIKQNGQYYANVVFPAQQTGFDYDSNTWEVGPYGSWGKEQFPYIAQSGNMLLTFRMLGGGLRFYLNRDDIKEIRFRGVDNEVIAGTCMVSMNGGTPSIVSFDAQSSTSEIVLKAPNGGTFKKSEGNTKYYYYLSIPPQEYQYG